MADGDVLMLGVSGMRGVVGSTLTPSVISGFTGAFGSWLKHKSAAKARPIVVMGRDGRAGGIMVRDAAAAGLVASGCDVLDAGIAMTPTMGVLVDALGADAGIVLTASHNPQNWNGVKLLVRDHAKRGSVSASAPSKATADEIIARYRAGQTSAAPWNQLGVVRDVSKEQIVHLRRVESLMGDLKLAAHIKKARFDVVLDSVNGAGGPLARLMLERLGCSVTHLGDNADGRGLFSHTPEPTRENLAGLSGVVRKHKGDIGFAQDPDADRLAIIDEAGNYIGEEYTLVLAARAVLELGRAPRRSAIAVNLSTSRMIDDLAAAHSVKIIRTSVGEANVVEAMKKHKCIIGGEGNGGVIWPRVTYVRDSLSAMALVLGLMAKTGKTLSHLVREMPAYAIEKRKVSLARKDDAKPTVAKIAKTYAKQRVDLQDGVRVDFHSRGSWVHVRASNTEPIMRLIAEAPTKQEAASLLDEVAKLIR